MDKLEVSIIVATFNPDEEKLLYTLNSILFQKKVNLEIIIADDGSEKFPRNKIEEFFFRKKFRNYSFNILKNNSGTVINIFESSKKAKGKYCKLISPGDFLYHPYALRNWIDFMDQSNYDISYCDAVYYKNIKNPIIEKKLAHPQKTSTEKEKILINYLQYNDFFLGAATLMKASILSNYINEIVYKVKYAEDNIYRLMVADGCSVGYFPKIAILYEFGEGISTAKSNIWNKRLKEDLKATNKILLKRNLPKNIKNKLEIENCGKNIGLNSIGNLLFILQKRIIPRKTSGIVSLSYFEKIKSI